MPDGISGLSEREKETLRLLLAGHDAKSIARHFDLSVHTVNERLRDARRKLGVSSSREAARLLARREDSGPNSLADEEIGVRNHEPAAQKRLPYRILWLSGGMLMMSLIVAAAALFAGSHGTAALTTQASAPAQSLASASASPAVRSASEWAALLDRHQWKESWAEAGTLFRSQVSESVWASKVEAVRQPLGPVSSRTLQGANKAASLPGAPDGQYEIVQFQTNFANKNGAVETVVLAHEGSGWRVDGYFIR